MTDIDFYRTLVIEILKQTTMVASDNTFAKLITNRAFEIFSKAKKIENEEINVFKVSGKVLMDALESQSKFKDGGITTRDYTRQ